MGRTGVKCGLRESILENPTYDLYWEEADRTFWTWNDDLDLVRVTQTGDEVYRHAPFTDPWDAVALNPSDGSLTFVNGKTATALQIARDGTEQNISLSYNPLPAFASSATGFTINPHDGSFWVSLADGRTSANPKWAVPSIFHLAADGTGIGEIAATGARLMQVDPSDDSLWVVESYPEARFAHFAADGTELWHDSNPNAGMSLSVNVADGSCWGLDGLGIRHFAKDGTQLKNIPVTDPGFEVIGGAVDPVTGFYWLAFGPYVYVYTPGGKLLWQDGGFNGGASVQVSLRDGSIWLYSAYQGQIVHLWVPVTVFPDVLYDNWAAYGVSLCYRAGIVSGGADGNYNPGGVVTRGQMAVFVSRALAKGDANVPPGPDTASFPDVATNYWAFKYVEYAHANSIVQGGSDGKYSPEASVDPRRWRCFSRARWPIRTGTPGWPITPRRARRAFPMWRRISGPTSISSTSRRRT